MSDFILTKVSAIVLGSTAWSTPPNRPIDGRFGIGDPLDGGDCFDIATGPFVPVVGLLKLGVFISIKGTKYTTKIAYQAIDSVTESIAKESQSLMELQTYKILDGLRDGGDIRTRLAK